MTRHIPIDDDTLLTCGLRATVTEAARQRWKPEDNWLGYTNHPRPYSGLILICADIEMIFSSSDGSLTAHRGDVVYVPSGMQYRVSFRGSAPDSHLDSYTVNFDLFDGEGNKVLLSDSILLLSRDPRNRR